MNEAKLEAIRKIPYPTTKKELQCALGLLSYYRKFVHKFTDYAQPLYQYLAKEYTSKNFSLTTEDKENFDALKSALIKNALLALPDFDAAVNNNNRRLTIFSDASKVGLGAILAQADESGFFVQSFSHPVVYYQLRLGMQPLSLKH